MAHTTGTVDVIQVTLDRADVTVSGNDFLIWSDSDYSLHALEWLSMCKAALTGGLEVRIDHPQNSFSPTSIRLLREPASGGGGVIVGENSPL